MSRDVSFTAPLKLCRHWADGHECGRADDTVRQYLQGDRCAEHAPDVTADPRRSA